MTSTAEPVATVRSLASIAVGEVDAGRCADLLGDIRHVRGWLDSIEAQVTSRLRRLHATAGSAPAADLHAKCGGVSAAEGKRKERRSEMIDAAPSFGEALASGEVGSEHVDALSNVTSKLDDQTTAALLALEADLLVDATRMSPEKFGRACRDLARRLERDHGIERNRRQRRDTFLTRKLNAASGMVEGRFAFHPELANQVFGAIDCEVAAMIKAGTARGDTEFVERCVDRNHLAAEALGRLVAGGHQQVRPLEADITLIVHEQTAATGELHEHGVCETTDGAALPPASVQRLLCNGRVTPVVIDQHGNPFDMGRTIRHANPRQRRALRAMYRCCAFGDCDVMFDRCEIHHLVPWELGGATDLANLLPLCSRHHHVVHDGGWQLELSDDRVLTVRQPDDRVFAVTRPDLVDRPATRRRTAA